MARNPILFPFVFLATFVNPKNVLLYKCTIRLLAFNLFVMRKIVHLTLLILCTRISMAQYENTQNQEFRSYTKPEPSNGPCIDSIENVQSMTMLEFSGRQGHTIKGEKCLGCSDMSQQSCPAMCQKLINAIYSTCIGVSLPPFYYFDPPVR